MTNVACHYVVVDMMICSTAVDLSLKTSLHYGELPYQVMEKTELKNNETVFSYILKFGKSRALSKYNVSGQII